MSQSLQGTLLVHSEKKLWSDEKKIAHVTSPFKTVLSQIVLNTGVLAQPWMEGKLLSKRIFQNRRWNTSCAKPQIFRLQRASFFLRPPTIDSLVRVPSLLPPTDVWACVLSFWIKVLSPPQVDFFQKFFTKQRENVPKIIIGLQKVVTKS